MMRCADLAGATMVAVTFDFPTHARPKPAHLSF
jgi:hypothetical protein